ncbi:unnamed protein product [Echinostoma caproni]|uniref:Uncharacterized protein n=1 Tax=Echinostoma caproni TaxID=27848 RepID=A0A183ASA4_9TREM|nr:unnamed protein product [Echinostoma caproni]
MWFSFSAPDNSPNDFNGAYVACLQTTRWFLVWRGQFVPSKVFAVSSPKGLKELSGLQNEARASQLLSTIQPDASFRPGKASVDLASMNTVYLYPVFLWAKFLRGVAELAELPQHTLNPSRKAGYRGGATDVSSWLMPIEPSLNSVQPEDTSLEPAQSTTDSVVSLLCQHPGRRFSNLAADRGRRLMSQGMMGLNKLGRPHRHPKRYRDINANWRAAVVSGAAGGSGGVISKFSDAFKSFLGGSGGGGTTSSGSQQSSTTSS